MIDFAALKVEQERIVARHHAELADSIDTTAPSTRQTIETTVEVMGRMLMELATLMEKAGKGEKRHIRRMMKRHADSIRQRARRTSFQMLKQAAALDDRASAWQRTTGETFTEFMMEALADD